MEYQDEQCYNAIPVIHGETKNREWILPGSRILIPPQELVLVHCRYAPKIIVNGTVVGMGNRQLGILDIQLSNRTFKYHREIDTWSDFGSDYVNQFANMLGGGDDNLYTQKEMDEFLDVVRLDRMAREVTNIVTNAYCVEQQCTHYGKNSGFLDLDLSNLTDPTKKLDPYKVLISPVQVYIDSFRDFLAVFTFYLFIEWVARKIWALWLFLHMVYHGEFSRKDALLISFNPGGQLIQSLENIDAGRERNSFIITRLQLTRMELSHGGFKNLRRREPSPCFRDHPWVAHPWSAHPWSAHPGSAHPFVFLGMRCSNYKDRRYVCPVLGENSNH